VVKGHDDGLMPEQRHERDTKALQEKAARKATLTPRAVRTSGRRPARSEGTEITIWHIFSDVS
jgi:hypothetical protein